MTSAFLKKATATIFCALIWVVTDKLSDKLFPHGSLVGTVFLGLFTLVTIVFALLMLVQPGDKFFPVLASPFVGALLAAFLMALLVFWPYILILALVALLILVIAAYWKGAHAEG